MPTPVTSEKNKNRDKSASAKRDRRVNRLVTSGVPLSQIELERQKIQAKIDIAAPGCESIPQFYGRLQSLGVEPISKITRTGKVQGVSYKCGEVVVRGSDLDDASFPTLQSARGIEYDEQRDLPSLRTIAKGGQLETNKDWTDRLPEIEAEIATQVITLMNQSDRSEDVSPMQMTKDFSMTVSESGDVCIRQMKEYIFINMDEAQREAEAWALEAQAQSELERESRSDWGR